MPLRKHALWCASRRVRLRLRGGRSFRVRRGLFGGGRVWSSVWRVRRILLDRSRLRVATGEVSGGYVL